MAAAKISPPPLTTPVLDAKGQITTAWALYFQQINTTLASLQAAVDGLATP